MPDALPGPGEVLPLTLELGSCPDPLALFARLSEGGRRPHCLLLESADQATRLAERSFLLPRCALQARCRGREVELRALSPGGRRLLPWLRERLAVRGEVHAAGEDALRVRYPPAPRGDERARLLAPSPTDALRTLAFELRLRARPAAISHLIAGVFAYDLLGVYEGLPEVPPGPSDMPDYLFWLPEELIILDHRLGRGSVLVQVFGGEGAEAGYHDAARRVEALSAACREVPPAEAAAESPLIPRALPEPAVDLSDEAFAAQVSRLKQRIVAGDVFQIVPSRSFSLPCPDPLAAYGRLRALNPSPYMFFLRGAEHTLFGASPETALRISGDPPRVEICPIAGTARRGRAPDGSLDLDLDGRLEAELRLSEKELAEHVMLIDLARNDVARVSEPGTRHVAKLLTVDRYSHVMHLVSHVEGRLRADLDALHAYVATMNMGTLVGAPKLKAAEILRGVEPARRGAYGGAVGYLTGDGALDSAIVIRSAVVSQGLAHVRAGAGVVYDSDPRAEAEETRRKAQAVLRALAEPSEEGA